MALAPMRDATLANVLPALQRDDPALPVIADLAGRVNAVRIEQERFRLWCDRADLLYYSEDFTAGGADLWASDPSATTAGRAHVSVNTPPVYVDVPASLQAVPPIENMLATDNTKEARTSAAATERVYTAWKAEEGFDLKFHKACTVKGLYGRTAARVYWDKEENRPCTEIIEQPRNLWMGYARGQGGTVEWAAYLERKTPSQVAMEFGVDITVQVDGSKPDMPWVLVPTIIPDTTFNQTSRAWLQGFDARIEVWDYWYRQPVFKGMKFVRMETWNVVVAGNAVVRGPVMYPEYGGTVPYVPIFNTYIPGVPNGRPDLYDIEPLIREKFEKITNGSQMIGQGVGGDYWQLVGPEAPARVPPGLKPEKNKLVAPGAGNRIETIAPFIAQFQLEQFLTRLDREMAGVSGLNDLLLGLAPAQVLSSSKAINALIANYETRLAMRRGLLYTWRRDVWELVWKVWIAKDKTIAQISKAGGGTLDIADPSLSPRDEMETATRASNLVAAKLWSMARGMDAVHVDDPETEQDVIREEQTDATLNPAAVTLMAQLLSTLQSLNEQPNQATQGQAGQQASSAQDSLRQALGQQTSQNTTSSQLPGDQGVTPPIPGAAPEAGGAPAPFAQPPAGNTPPQQGQTAQLQSMIQGGAIKSRILTQRKLNGGR